MSTKPEVISRGSFRCHLVRLSGGAIRLEAYFSPGDYHSAWQVVYPPHAITEARLAARYFCRVGRLLTYAQFSSLSKLVFPAVTSA